MKMEEFAVFKFENMEKHLEEKHPHKVVAIHKGNVISIGDTYDKVMKNLSFKKKALPKKYYTLYTRIKESFIDLHPKLNIDCPVGRNLFGEIDIHLRRKSDGLVLDLEMVAG